MEHDFEIWDTLKHFNKNEAWGKPQKINGLLLLLLDKIRDLSGWPIIIHCGTQGHHVRHSQHFKGNAVDFHFETEVSLKEQVVRLLEILDILQVGNRVGLGVYRWGFHLDVRGTKARWGRIGKDYISFEEAVKYL